MTADMPTAASPARIGVGGPVGSGKTALIERLIPVFDKRNLEVAIVTNDLVTKEDAERLRGEHLADLDVAFGHPRQAGEPAHARLRRRRREAARHGDPLSVAAIVPPAKEL